LYFVTRFFRAPLRRRRSALAHAIVSIAIMGIAAPVIGAA